MLRARAGDLPASLAGQGLVNGQTLDLVTQPRFDQIEDRQAQFIESTTVRRRRGDGTSSGAWPCRPAQAVRQRLRPGSSE